MRSIGLVSEKGGVGKTTTVLNLAAGLAARRLRVLVIDTDPQGNCSHVLLKGSEARRPAIAEVLLAEVEAQEAIVTSPAFEGVDVLPANQTLADATITLANEVGRERRLRVALEGLGSRYDFVLVDTAPTRSVVTTNVLNAVGELFVPMSPSLFGILGLSQLQTDVSQVRRFLDNRELAITGIVLTMAEKNNVARDLEKQLRELFGPIVFKTKIGRAVKLEEAHARHESIFSYAPTSPGALAYQAFTDEVLNHGREKNRDRHSKRHSPADHAA